MSDIVMPLPKPVSVCCTEWQNHFYKFYVKFEAMNVCWMYFSFLFIFVMYLKINT
jgi:hypothetical protein